MTREKGAFIVIDGIDGAGKSTQAYLLTKWLSESRVRVMPTREPGGTGIGERIREILLDPNGEEISDACEALLYMASRAQLVSESILPSLERGYVVISERYVWSTLAYQGYAAGVPIEKIEALAAFATGGLEPDLTIILDLDPELAVQREKVLASGEASYDRIEKKGVEFQKKVRQGFLEIARRHDGRMHVVDASRPAKAVLEEIKKLVSGVIG